MKRLALAAIVSVALYLVLAGTAMAQSKPEFKLGFKALADQISDVVGEPLENEHWGSNGDSLQQTATGLMVWRKADNWTAFTDGSRSWLNGPNGVQSRGNDERFEWEGGSRQTPVAADQGAAGDSSPSEAKAAARLMPSTLLVEADGAEGTGFVVGERLVLTVGHLVEDESKLTLQANDGRQLEGSVVARSSILDLALVRVPDLNLPPVTFADQSKVRPGDHLVALGYPLSGDQATVTRGICSAIRVFEGALPGEWVQTDAAMNPGNSGGPLANLNGEVVGISSWVLRQMQGISTEGLNFALSANSIKEFLPALLMVAGETPPGATPAGPELTQEVAEAVKRHDEAQIRVLATSDPTPVKDLESPALYSRTVIIAEFQKELGIRTVARLVDFQVRSAYQLSENVVALDLLERWQTQVYKGDVLFRDEGQTDQPQVNILKRTQAGWQQVAVEWREVKPLRAQPVSAPASEGRHTPDVKAMDQTSAGPGADLKKLIQEIDGEWEAYWKWRPSRPITVYLYSDGNRMVADAERLRGAGITQQEREYLLREQVCSFRDVTTGGYALLLTFNGAAWGTAGERMKARYNLLHEYAHLMTGDSNARNLPLWFIEGLAEYCAFAKDPGAVAVFGKVGTAAGYYDTGLLPSLRQLTTNSWYSLVAGSESTKRCAYGMAYLAVKYLAEKVGGERITRVLQATASGEGFEAALQRIAGYSVDQLDTEYRSTYPPKQ